MQVSPNLPVAALFSGFRLDLRTAELHTAEGKTARLSDQPFRILETLLQNAGDVVSREDLRKRLWPNDTIVEFEHSISAAMNRLRQALGDSAEEPKFIETLARRGYRFMLAVQFEEPALAPEPTSTPAPAGSKPQANGVASHYQILERLGGGGMGVVYRARDTRLNRNVALKFLPAELAKDEAALERFRREAQAASALNHPNICTIYDVGELPLEPGDGNEAQRFIAMEFLDGQTLERRISGKPLPLHETLELAIEIADALSAAHAQGIIHRDIKAANVFVTKRGSAKVLDFGLAKSTALSAPAASEPAASSFPASSATGAITVLGKAMGTPTYMSPEQVRGEQLDARSDLFSFGITLYQMATGVLPFRGETTDQISSAILHRVPDPPSHLNPAIPPRLEEIILKALEKNPKFRYQFAAEIRTDLQRLQRSANVEQPASSFVPDKARTNSKRSGARWPVAVLFVGFAVFLTTAALRFLFNGPPPPGRFAEDSAEARRPAVAPPVHPTAKAVTVKSQPRLRMVDLSSDFNLTGVYGDGEMFSPQGSLDGIGNAFPAEILDEAKTWDAVPFALGHPNSSDVVTSRTIALPEGKFIALKLLAVAVQGDQESQNFTANYSDGSSHSFSQSLSDWYTPENYDGEFGVAQVPYRVGSGGGRDDRTFHLYGYSFPLDSRKTIQSFTLPNNSHVLIFGLTLMRASRTSGTVGD
ncbi:MAG TPA: protein kinase [Terriglobales bacterium]|nr:protein kinase [Terriglobales bacterium]HUL16093.1 protein kinase [Terriglobales bacterium]